MVKFYRIAKEGGTKNDSKSVRFDLEEQSPNEFDQKQEESIIGGVQERFPGFFEMPECCVPFEMVISSNQQFDGDIQNGGFPQPIELASSSSNVLELKGNEKSKRKSLFAQRVEMINQKNGGNLLDFLKKENKGGEVAIPEIINNLEIIDTTKKASSESQRLAMDPVQMDLALKCLGNVLPRIEQQIVRLFDSLKCSPSSTTNQIDILEEARTNLDAIRSLYMEQIENQESGRRIWVFAKGVVEPLADPAWMLIPIRRVLDAIQQRSSFCATPDDVEIVRLSLLWTVLLMRERNALFKGFTNPSGFYCRLAETFLIGPEVFLHDEKINQCISMIIDEYLLEVGLKGQINIRLSEPIAGLDSFMPFYADLLQRFEEFSSGDSNFSLILLIGAYLNSSRLDALLTLQTLWWPQRNVVRQMRLPMDGRTELFLKHLKKQNENMDEIFGEEPQKSIEWQEYAKLRGHYEDALKNGVVTAERNPMILKIAEYELREFQTEKT